jgi:hypothetical protein
MCSFSTSVLLEGTQHFFGEHPEMSINNYGIVKENIAIKRKRDRQISKNMVMAVPLQHQLTTPDL